MKYLLCLLAAVPLAAFAGGSNYGITPGAHPNLAGKVSEWPLVPTPRFARDPAPGPDRQHLHLGHERQQKLRASTLKTRPSGNGNCPPAIARTACLSTSRAIVWTTGNAQRHHRTARSATGKVTEYQTPSRGGGPHTLVIADTGVIWFNPAKRRQDRRLDTRGGGQITEYKTSGGLTASRSYKRATSGFAAWATTNSANSIRKPGR